MRADVNLSVREVGQKEFGTRTEMKNLNSFKAIAHAIEGEQATTDRSDRRRARRSYRKQDAGMIQRVNLMQCEAKKMHRITVTSQIRT